MKLLRVRARGEALVANQKHQDNGIKSFVGWKHDASLGEDALVLDEKGAKQKIRQGGWKQLDSVVEIDSSNPEHLREYAVAIADGDLWAGDEAAAEIARRMTGKPVQFDPLFGAPKSDVKKGA